ncbi:MAG: phosphoribosyltransferase, partial [Bifidobacterium psychraerophilum]
ASVEVFALLEKPARREVEFDVKYRGFEIPDEFVVGFGLDYCEEYRNLDSIAVLKPQVYQGEHA